MDVNTMSGQEVIKILVNLNTDKEQAKIINSYIKLLEKELLYVKDIICEDVTFEKVQTVLSAKKMDKLADKIIDTSLDFHKKREGIFSKAKSRIYKKGW